MSEDVKQAVQLHFSDGVINTLEKVHLDTFEDLDKDQDETGVNGEDVALITMKEFMELCYPTDEENE